ncbi:MAG: substrate-binding domain-containing protein [Alphaproteobacteria bacterium]
MLNIGAGWVSASISAACLVGLSTSAQVASAQADPRAALDALQQTVLSTGPGGEQPVSAADVVLSGEEVAQVQSMGATAALVFHYGGNDWSQAQIDGLTARFGELGIEIVAVTDAGFKPDKQVSDIETVLAQEPDIIVSIPVDPVATADAYKRAADAGVHLVFMDNVPAGLKVGDDYVSVVSADNYGNGVASAHLMAEALDGSGSIGVVYHAADFFVTRQRYDAFTATIAEDYPGIELAVEQGIGGPDFAGEAERVASAMLTANPNLDGVWAVWDVPAEGVIAAARAAGRDDLVITTIDLGENVAISIAQDSFVYGLGAQRPYDQGVTEANLAAYALLGKPAPDYVALPALPVSRENLLDAWQTVYHAPAPDTVQGLME